MTGIAVIPGLAHHQPGAIPIDRQPASPLIADESGYPSHQKLHFSIVFPRDTIQFGVIYGLHLSRKLDLRIDGIFIIF